MKNKSFLNYFEYITEIVGWIQFFISPLIVGYIAYYFIQNTLGIIIGVSIGLVGFILGFILSNRSWKKGRTVKFLSRVISTPDIDKDLYKDPKEQPKPDNE